MNACYCSLAGTAACKYCANNPTYEGEINNSVVPYWKFNEETNDTEEYLENTFERIKNGRTNDFRSITKS